MSTRIDTLRTGAVAAVAHVEQLPARVSVALPAFPDELADAMRRAVIEGAGTGLAEPPDSWSCLVRFDGRRFLFTTDDPDTGRHLLSLPEGTPAVALAGTGPWIVRALGACAMPAGTTSARGQPPMSAERTEEATG